MIKKTNPYINRSIEQDGMKKMQLKYEHLGNDNAGLLINNKTKIYSIIDTGKMIRSLNKSKIHLIFIPMSKNCHCIQN